jgi:hypothetical protein
VISQLDRVPEMENIPSTSKWAGNSKYGTNTEDGVGLGRYKPLFLVKPYNTKNVTLPGFSHNQKGHKR